MLMTKVLKELSRSWSLDLVSCLILVLDLKVTVLVLRPSVLVLVLALLSGLITFVYIINNLL